MKELKKIEQTAEIPFGAKDSDLEEVTYHIPDGYHAEINGNEVVIKKGEQKPAWSEDETSIAIKNPDAYKIGFADGEEHAKEEMTTAWSKEDENALEAITYTVKHSGYSHCIGVSIEVMINWLKSLKERMKGD